MAARTPSRRNQYTGMFAGKNLILLTAESFSPWFISQELTPTLYRLTHEGFVFSNYYQPGWGQSTTGGEFAVLTGLLPTWVGGDVSFWASRYDYMPLALGNLVLPVMALALLNIGRMDQRTGCGGSERLGSL